MELVYDGKTKQILKKDQNLILRFKNTLTGNSSGSIDPDGDKIVDRREGKAEASAKTAAYFFELLEKEDISTHFLDVLSPTEIEIRPAEGYPLEVIYRG